MGKRQTKDKIMKKTNTKAKSAPAIEWIKGNRPGEWVGGIGGKPVFEITDDGVLYLLAGGLYRTRALFRFPFREARGGEAR